MKKYELYVFVVGLLCINTVRAENYSGWKKRVCEMSEEVQDRLAKTWLWIEKECHNREVPEKSWFEKKFAIQKEEELFERCLKFIKDRIHYEEMIHQLHDDLEKEQKEHRRWKDNYNHLEKKLTEEGVKSFLWGAFVSVVALTTYLVH